MGVWCYGDVVAVVVGRRWCRDSGPRTAVQWRESFKATGESMAPSIGWQVAALGGSTVKVSWLEVGLVRWVFAW